MKEASNKIINFFFVPLSAISLVGAISLLPGIIQFVSNGTLSICIFFLFFLWILFVTRHTHLIKAIFVDWTKHCKVHLFIFAMLLIFWQSSIVFYLSGTSLWDPNSIVLVAMGHLPSLKDYFSLNPNNVLMLLFERVVWVTFQKPPLKTFQIILTIFNVIVVDTAFVILIQEMFSRLKKGMKVSLPAIIMLVLLLASPWIVIVYTDLFGAFLTTLNIFLLIRMKNGTHRFGVYFYPLISGLCLAISYFMKPTLIIVYIAGAIIASIMWKNSKNMISIKQVSIFVLSALACLALFHTGLSAQKVVRIDPQKRETISHYVAMGMHGTGGFNLDDAKMEIKIKNPQKRNEANINLIKRRIKEYKSPMNYVKFLIKKQMANTADGTFSWGHEGGFLTTFNHQNKKYNRSIPRKIFTNAGVVDSSSYSYQLIAQLFWILTLFGVVACYLNSSWFAQFLKLSIVGFYVYLLLFEGGRSRYVIQFLPCMIFAMSLGLESVWRIIKYGRSAKFLN